MAVLRSGIKVCPTQLFVFNGQGKSGAQKLASLPVKRLGHFRPQVFPVFLHDVLLGAGAIRRRVAATMQWVYS